MPIASTMPIPAASPAPHLAEGRVQHLDFTRIDPIDFASFLSSRAKPPTAVNPDTVANRLARFLMRPNLMTFASGDSALRHTLSALLTRWDHVIVDHGAGSAMFETVLRALAHLHRCPPGSVEAVERRLSRLARQPRTGRIFVIVPAVARLSSVTANLGELCSLCATYGATLVVDLSQDFGVMGEAGLGIAEAEGCLARIDVILGDLSGTVGAACGIAAFREPALCARVAASRKALPLSATSATTIMAALDLIESVEGQRRRHRLHGAALRLRNHLMADGLPVMGHPSPVVPLRLSPGTANHLTALAASVGLLVPLVQAPEVAGHAPRWLIRLNAGHGPADIDCLADILHDLIRSGNRWPRALPRS